MPDKKMIESEYRGYRLIYYEEWDKWGPAAIGSPIGFGSMAEVKRDIDRWEVEKQKAAGVPVWCLRGDTPGNWYLGEAVFRRGGDSKYGAHDVRYVRLRNGVDPDHFYDLERDKVALDTPDVRAAIDDAKALHAEAVAASKRWRDARDRIPKMTVEEWQALPERGKEG